MPAKMKFSEIHGYKNVVFEPSLPDMFTETPLFGKDRCRYVTWWRRSRLTHYATSR